MRQTLHGIAKGSRMIHEIRRLRALGFGLKKIAAALCISKNTVKKYLAEASDADTGATSPRSQYVAPWAHALSWEVFRQATESGDPVSRLWEEHIAASSDPILSGVSYVSFWREYKRRYPQVPLEMHKTYHPGVRAEADYKGDADGLGYTDLATGEYVTCRMYGAILCFSQLFYAEATRTEQQIHMLPATANAFEYFHGIPCTWAIDNAKTTVYKAHRYDADLNPEFQRFCEYYGTAPLAMRPGEPKDKAVIENALGVFWRWARKRIRSNKFYSLAEVNRFLHSLLEIFNNRIQRKYGLSRRQKYVASEVAVLLAIPESPYEIGEWKKHKVHPDCHIQVAYNFYSVPYKYRGLEVDVRVNSSLLQVFIGLECIATHVPYQSAQRGRYLTIKGHLPEAHLAILEATPQFVTEQAEKIGPSTHQIILAILASGTHPLQYLRRIQGILRLGGKRYGKPALEAACKILVDQSLMLPRTRDLEVMMKNAVLAGPTVPMPAVERRPNPNLRGQMSWSKDKLH